MGKALGSSQLKVLAFCTRKVNSDSVGLRALNSAAAFATVVKAFTSEGNCVGSTADPCASRRVTVLEGRGKRMFLSNTAVTTLAVVPVAAASAFTKMVWIVAASTVGARIVTAPPPDQIPVPLEPLRMNDVGVVTMTAHIPFAAAIPNTPLMATCALFCKP